MRQVAKCECARWPNSLRPNTISRVNEIKEEISNFFGIPVDLADSSGMGKTAKKFIIDKAIYV